MAEDVRGLPTPVAATCLRLALSGRRSLCHTRAQNGLRVEALQVFTTSDDIQYRMKHSFLEEAPIMKLDKYRFFFFHSIWKWGNIAFSYY